MRVVWLLAVALAGCIQVTPDVPVVAEPEPDANLLATLQTLGSFPEFRLETDRGDIRMLLYTGWLPQTTSHISALVERDFYDGTIIHRVVDDFVIQGGDPTGTGEGGSGSAGTSDMIPLEIKEGLQFGSGAVGLARWTDDTGDSQWFITEKPALHLNDPQGATGDVFGAYSLFAQVFNGMEVVREIAAVETLPNDRPIEDVGLSAAHVLSPPSDVDLFGVLTTVSPGVWLGEYVGHLEVPTLMVTDHPAKIRFTSEGEACAIAGTPGVVGSGVATAQPWVAVAHDGCTVEAWLTFTQAGSFTITTLNSEVPSSTNAVAASALAWHPDYAPFTGTLMNDA